MTWLLVAVLAGSQYNAFTAEHEKISVSDQATLSLLRALDEQEMPDVVLWILDSVAKEKEAGKTLQQEVAFRRATALVGVSQSEGDAEKRVQLLDNAEQALDSFLADDPPLRLRIEALMQKGGLLVARGRVNLEKAKRPGADASSLRSASVPFFDKAISALQGKMAGKKEPITDISNAEDAVLKALREADAELKAVAAEKEKPGSLGRSGSRSITRMEEDREELRGKLLQVRLLVADALFDKSQAFLPDSKESNAALESSTEKYEELYKKYPNRGAGLLARCNEGRNYAVAGDYKKALSVLNEMLAIEGNGAFFITLKRKALNAALQCWLAEKRYDAFSSDMLITAKSSVPDEQLDQDVLGMKYRAALLLTRRAEAISEQEAPKKKPLWRDAGKLALEVAKASREYAIEARDLLASLGSDFDSMDGQDASFSLLMDQAKLSLTTMQEQRALAKQAVASKQDAAAKQATSSGDKARSQAISFLQKAIEKSEGEEIEEVNQARYLLTYLLYESREWLLAAQLGQELFNRYPNSRGSDQAAMIAMASWQQLYKQADSAEAATARVSCENLAKSIIERWPDSKAAGDAAVVAIALAVESDNPSSISSLLNILPKNLKRREEVLMRAGLGLVRRFQEVRKAESNKPSDQTDVESLKKQAMMVLDQGLAAGANLPPSAVSVSAAFARCQLAMDDGDEERVSKVLENPNYGPWTVVNGTIPPGVSKSFVGNVLTLSLRHFISAQKIEKADQAIALLEAQAGEGPEAAAKLTALYLSMGRQLQQQLQTLAGEAKAPERAAKILLGFESFLDRVSKPDAKTDSLMWVASMYDALSSGEGLGTVVSKKQQEKYLSKAAEVYERLLDGRLDEVVQYEPTIRLKLAGNYQQEGKWEAARKHINWFLGDVSRQNMIEPQIAAAKIAQAVGESSSDASEAANEFREAVSGNQTSERTSWGWGGIANKLVRQAFSGTDERAKWAQAQFFDARLNLAKCRLAWAERSTSDKADLLGKAFNDIALTYKLYPALGGPEKTQEFDAVLRSIQKAQGQPPEGLAAIDKSVVGGGT